LPHEAQHAATRVRGQISNPASSTSPQSSAGLTTLNEGQNIEYEIEENRAKTSAVDLKVK
jgi:hypothetical protein